jgi:hypothetical protein
MDNLSLEDIITGTRSSRLGLDARPTTLFYKNYCCEIQKVKTGCNLVKSSEEGYGSKRAVMTMLIFITYIYVPNYYFQTI